MSDLLITIGRIMLGLFFVVSGGLKLYGAVTDPAALTQLAGYIGSRIPVQPQLLAYATIAFELIAGLALVFGVLTLPIGLLLAAFCVVTAVLFHNFWSVPPAQMQGQLNSFLKNIGLAGGYLAVAGIGLRGR